ncbi:MAG: 16S rRNA (cytidine(1402)-2'-O)-methyltransferase, partial [Pseudomonadota bacterium]
TKKFEETVRAPLSELALRYAAGPPKGEIVVVVGPPEAVEASAEDLDQALRTALLHASVRDAAAEVAARLGVPRKRAYARALSLERD